MQTNEQVVLTNRPQTKIHADISFSENKVEKFDPTPFFHVPLEVSCFSISLSII